MHTKDVPIAKISRPVLPDVYPRKRLFRLLDKSSAPIIWVAGPPGSGKTTVVASYLDARKLSCIWYQLDEGDSDIATFFYYMGLAAKKAAPRIKQPLPLLTPEYQFGIPTFTRRYFENIFSRLKPPSVIVFDNYQEVPEDSPFHEVMLNGLSEIPRGIKVIVISRADQPAGFARMQANNIMSIIGWEQLQLTREETSGMMKHRTGKPVSKESQQKLYEKTSGWAAGVVLMEAFQARGGEQIEPEAMEPGKLSDYFATEIFAKISEEMRGFLLKTSYLPRMTPCMAEAITGNGRAGQLLADLNKRNYFTERRPGPEPVYQYHSLFRKFLIRRAEGTLQPLIRGEIQQTAAKLLEESGEIEDAAGLFQEAQDWEQLVRLTLTHAPALMAQGRSRTLRDWIMGIPKEIQKNTPWLLYWMGISSMPYDLSLSRSALEQSYALFKKHDDISGIYLSWSGIVETFVYEWGDFRPLDRWISEMESLLRERPRFPTPEIEARVTIGMFCALMYRQTHHPDLPRWEERVLHLVHASEDINLKLLTSSHLIFYYTWWTGDQVKARTLVTMLRHAVQSAENSVHAAILWRMIEAASCWMTAETRECLVAVETGLRRAAESGIHLWDFLLAAQASFGTLSAGDLDAARPFLRTMERTVSPNHLLNSAMCRSHLAWEAMHQRRFSAALEHMKAAVHAAASAGVPFVHAFVLMGQAEVQIELGNYGDADKLLCTARDTGIAISSSTVQCQSLWLSAFLRQKQGAKKEAMELMKQHIAGSRERGSLNHPFWRSAVMIPLYAMALENGIEVEYVRDLIRKRDLIPEEPPYHISNWPWPIRIHTLGRFDLLKDDNPVRFSGKVQKKPLEMLKALIAFGGKEVPAEQIATALWPDADGDAAYKAFGITLIRLRKLLGVRDAVHLSEGAVTLDQRYFWVDTWAFEKMIEDADSPSPHPLPKGERTKARGKVAAGFSLRTEKLRLLEKALELYKGPFLGAESAPWAISLRERLKDKFLRSITTAGMYWEESKEWDKAIGCYKKGLEADDLVEEFYRRIIICCQRLDRNAEALSAYNRCKKTLTSYGIELSSETKALLKKD